MKIFAIATMLLVFGSFGFAQIPDTSGAQRSEMKKLEAGIGHWEGTGWSMHNGVKHEFQGSEIVQKKLDGVTMLVEGRFTDKAKPDMVVHQTLAVINYDIKEKNYKFKTYLLNGNSGMHNIKLIDGGWEWGFEIPNGGGTIRYTIKLSADTWHEVGEYSKDGKVWIKMFEMTLKKKA